MAQRSFRLKHQGVPRTYNHQTPPKGEGFDFHDPYPLSPQAYLNQYGISLTNKASTDRVMALPIEIKDQVLAYLSVMDLDAARFACKTWWVYITANVWLLRTVLFSIDSPYYSRQSRYGKYIDDPSELRRLAIEFDDAAIEQHNLHKDRSWKQNFRAVDVQLGSSTCLSLGKQTIEWVSYWNPVRVVILLVKFTPDFQGDISMTGEKKRIMFYSLDTCGRPVHLGTVSCPNLVTEVEIVGLGDTELSRSFDHPIILRSRCHTWLRHCRVEQRASFMNTESFLKLTVVEVDFTQSTPVHTDDLELGGEDVTTTDQYGARVEAIRSRNVLRRNYRSSCSLQQAAAKQDEPNAGIIEDRVSGRWATLKEPDQIERYKIDSRHPYAYSERLVAAKHIDTKQLHLVTVCYTKDVDLVLAKKSCAVKSEIHISAPRRGMVFRNLSVSYGGEQRPMSKKHQFCMVIIWVDPSSPSRPGELYLYKPTPDRSARPNKIHGLRQIRISSVPPGIGGLHKESPLRQQQDSIWCSTDQTDGGLVLNPKVKSGPDIKSTLRGVPNATTYVQRGFQIVISGVSKEDGKAYLRILDLNPQLDDPWGSSLVDAEIPNGSRMTLPDRTSKGGSKRFCCTCPMHDLTYTVSLPKETSDVSDVLDKTSVQSMDDFTLILPRGSAEWRPVFGGDNYQRCWNEACAELKLSKLRQHFNDMLNGASLPSRGWTTGHGTSPQSVDNGTVTQYTSPHRAAGLERLKRRGQLFIEALRKDGLSDEEIANWWPRARWCWWNLLAKPDGWRR
ncbi:hypothetical protein MMC18_007775 [Xylographa bjoerkii]|nr:hypothetical protein [Xylographa bjoerkii]